MSRDQISVTTGANDSTFNRVTGTLIPAEGKTALDTVVKSPITGTFSPSGLNIGWRITTMDVGDTQTAIPPVALTSRNAMSIENKDASETLFVGPTGLTADTVLGTTSGWEIKAQESFNIDVTPTIVVYGRAPTGKTIRLKILELA